MLEHPAHACGSAGANSARLFSRLCRRRSLVRQHSANREWIASQHVGEHYARLIADAVNNLPKEAFRRVLIAATAQDVIQAARAFLAQ